MDPLILIGIGVVVIVAVVIIIIQTIGRLLRKVGHNQALIVYGACGTQGITGGSHFVLPLYQRAQDFSLELMSFDVAPPQDLYTTQGVTGTVQTVRQLRLVKKLTWPTRGHNVIKRSRRATPPAKQPSPNLPRTRSV